MHVGVSPLRLSRSQLQQRGAWQGEEGPPCLLFVKTPGLLLLEIVSLPGGPAGSSREGVGGSGQAGGTEGPLHLVLSLLFALCLSQDHLRS